MSAAYGPEKALEFLASLKFGGLVWYNRIQALDMLFPFSYSFFLAGILRRIYGRKYEKIESYWWIPAIPLMAGSADLLENILIRVMILSGESSVPVISRLAGGGFRGEIRRDYPSFSFCPYRLRVFHLKGRTLSRNEEAFSFFYRRFRSG